MSTNCPARWTATTDRGGALISDLAEPVTEQEHSGRRPRCAPMNGGEPRCHVCCSAFRDAIDLDLADPANSAADVASRFAPAGISERSMRRHRGSGHRHLYELESRSGVSPVRTEVQGEEVVDVVRFAKEVLTQTWERLLDGQIRPNLKDAYRSVRILEEYDDRPVLDRAMVEKYFWKMVTISEQFMSGNQRAFRNAINEDVDVQLLHWVLSGKSLADIPIEEDEEI